MHIKRKTIPTFWPVSRTGTKYLALPQHDKESSISLVVIARDIIGLVKNKKELKKIINEKKILINNRIVREINYPISLFDCIAVPSVKKYYKIILKGRKFEPISVPEKETKSKMYKVISKTYLSGKKLQLNLSQGRNVLLNEKEKAENIKSGDFVVMDNSKNNIIKIISIKKDVGVVIVKGKHFGIEGKVIDIIKEGENELAIIKTKDGEIKVNIDNIFAKD